jgi:hypothetical protein
MTYGDIGPLPLDAWGTVTTDATLHLFKRAADGTMSDHTACGRAVPADILVFLRDPHFAPTPLVEWNRHYQVCWLCATRYTGQLMGLAAHLATRLI